MNNISDKLVMTIILITILFVFGLIFSVKSPERKVIDSPIMWKDDYSNISIFKNNNIYSEVIFFDNEGHGFRNIENKEVVMQKSQEFLKNALNIAGS